MLYMFELQIKTPAPTQNLILTQNPNSIYYSKSQLQSPSVALNMNSNSKFQLHILTQYFSSKHLIGYFYLELVLRVGIWSWGWSSNIKSMGKILIKLGYFWSLEFGVIDLGV